MSVSEERIEALEARTARLERCVQRPRRRHGTRAAAACAGASSAPNPRVRAPAAGAGSGSGWTAAQAARLEELSAGGCSAGSAGSPCSWDCSSSS